MPRHLFIRNGRYYFRQWIPLDLRSSFGGRTDVAKSLKTRDRKEALALAGGLQQRYQLTFSLLRTGLLSPEQASSLLDGTTAQKLQRLAQEPLRSPPPPTPAPSLSALIDLFTQEHHPKWTPKTQQEFSGQFKVLVKVLGDCPVSSFDRPSCVSCRDTLRKLPPGFTKKKHLMDKPVSVLVQEESVGMQPKTVNKYITLLSTLFKWGVKHGYMKSNPAEGLTLELLHKPDEERKAYETEDIKRILEHLPNNIAKEPEKRWVPLIALYSGMRLEEICQLTGEDIRNVDGVLCFDVNTNGDKRLKTKASTRLVPVHPALLNMGLEEYTKSRLPYENLWGLSKGKWGYGKKVTNWWSSIFNRKYVTNDPLKCFHSFRHTFADTLKQAGVEEVIISELMGHANHSITTGRYGKRYRPQMLLDTVCKLDYRL
ncbi:site-specific integrase [Geobacter anodireducens]